MKIKDIIVPQFGENKAKVTIAFWFKNEGESVKEGEELVEVQVDKAILDIESPASGRLRKITAGAGRICRPGQKIGEIEVKSK